MTATSRSNSRRNLLLIAAIAFVPMFIAYGVFFFAPELIPQNTTNRGQLMSPPVDLTGKLPVTEEWQLVLVPRSACANDCTDLIHQTRQIHIALGIARLGVAGHKRAEAAKNADVALEFHDTRQQRLAPPIRNRQGILQLRNGRHVSCLTICCLCGKFLLAL